MNYEDFAIETVKKAGALLMQLRKEKFGTTIKDGNPRDIVTTVDTEVNDLIVTEVNKAFPEHSIYSEEGSGTERESQYEWTVDPIDGSANFSRGIPHFAVCLGLLEDGVSAAGALFNPVTNELFSFTKGMGARLNGESIRVSAVSNLAEAQAVFSPGSRNPELFEWATKAFHSLLTNVQKRGIYGSSSLDICFVAAGRADVAVYGMLSARDVTCAFGILTEAGGASSDANGNPVLFTGEPQKIYLANNPEMLAQVRSLLEVPE